MGRHILRDRSRLLDGFAVGAMMSGAFFLAVTAPRRARRRQAAAVGAGGALAVGPRGWLSKHASAGRAPRAEGSGAEVLGRGTFGPGTFGADAERVAQPDEPGAEDRAGGAPPSGRDGRIAGGYRSRHRLGDPVPGQTLPGGPTRDGASPGSAPRESARPSSAFPDSAFPDSAFPDSALPGAARPESPGSDLPEGAFPDGTSRRVAPSDAPVPDVFPDITFPDGTSRRVAPPDAPVPDVFPDIMFPDGTFGSSKRPEARRMPRHAAPAAGFRRKMSNRVTGLFAARPLTSGARG